VAIGGPIAGDDHRGSPDISVFPDVHPAAVGLEVVGVDPEFIRQVAVAPPADEDGPIALLDGLLLGKEPQLVKPATRKPAQEPAQVLVDEVVEGVAGVVAAQMRLQPRVVGRLSAGEDVRLFYKPKMPNNYGFFFL